MGIKEVTKRDGRTVMNDVPPVKISEEKVLGVTADLWNDYIKLPDITDCEANEVAGAIHTIQGWLAIRLHRKDVQSSPFKN